MIYNKEKKDNGKRWKYFKKTVGRCDALEFSAAAGAERQRVLTEGSISPQEFDFFPGNWKYPSGNADWWLNVPVDDLDKSPQNARPLIITQSLSRRVYFSPLHGDLTYAFNANFLGDEPEPLVAQSVDFDNIRSQKNSRRETNGDRGFVERIKLVSLATPEGYFSYADVSLLEGVLLTITPDRLYFDDIGKNRPVPLQKTEVAQFGFEDINLVDDTSGARLALTIDGDRVSFYLSREMVPNWWRLLIDRGEPRMFPVTKSKINLSGAEIA